jgi:uncharacterized Fe-S center protein
MKTPVRNPVYFASAIPERMDRNLTLPARFMRLLEKMPIQKRIHGRSVVVKMHLGGGLGYSTIHPLFVKMLVDHLKAGKPRRIIVSDSTVDGCAVRGYTEETIGAPLVAALGPKGKSLVSRKTGWEPLPEIKLGKPLVDADVLINFSHVKGHGDCGFGGACKNLGMGCVPAETRGAIHRLEGDLKWDPGRCIHCNKCIEECPTHAAKFNGKSELEIFWHHCKMCQHCALICPSKAIRIRSRKFDLFQEGLARVAKLVIDEYKPGLVFHINVLTHITLFCDCWGLTTPALVPDIGIFGGEDIVAVEDASLKAIKTENYIPGSLTPPFTLGTGKHLFEKIHSRDPYRQVLALERLGAGSRRYQNVTVD